MQTYVVWCSDNDYDPRFIEAESSAGAARLFTIPGAMDTKGTIFVCLKEDGRVTKYFAEKKFSLTIC